MEDATRAARQSLSSEEKRRLARAPGNAGARRIVRARRTVQAATLLLFVAFFFLTTPAFHNAGVAPKNLFLSLDFLNTLKNGIASRHIAIAALIPGLLVLLLTLWGGRIFCGWICPLGTCIDAGDRLLFRRGRCFHNPNRTDTRRFRNWKYAYLLAGLAAIAWGVDILAFGDPLSLITRAFTFGVYGPVAYLWNGLLGLASLAGADHIAFRAISADLDAWRMMPMSFYNALPAVLLFIGVVALSAWQERFWCRNLCPYGGLLALVSRVSLLRHSVRHGACIHCEICEGQSRMGAYENLSRKARKPIEHNIGECIQCFRCEAVCPPDAIQIEVRPIIPLTRTRPSNGGHEPAEPQGSINIGRRRILAALGAGLLWGAMARVSASNFRGRLRKYPRNNRAIRPPGALPEAAFLSACTRCGACMKVCPTNGLQPAFLETGPEGICTPVLDPSIGPCAERCTACGDVCPTRAIRPFTWQDKRYKIRLGLASVNRNTCIAFNGGRDCVVCAEVCPYSAVIFRDTWDDTLPRDPSLPISEPGNKGRLKRVPTVDETLCTGCGICEFQCPVLPDHAIIVYTSQEDREYRAPRESPWDGLARPNYARRKEQGKDAEYAPTRERFEEHIRMEGPDAGGEFDESAGSG